MSATQKLKRAGLSTDVWSADPATGLVSRNFGIVEPGVLTDAIAANQNDYNPAGLAQAHHIRLNPNNNYYMAGIVGGVDGRILHLTNINSAFTIQFFNQAVASAANQFITPRGFPFILYPNQEVDIWYDGLSQKWRMLMGGPITTTLSVVVPALAAAALGYADVSLAGSALTGLTTTDHIIINPESDLAAAGAGNGGFLNGRVSALNTCRLTFLGAVAGGATNFKFTYVL